MLQSVIQKFSENQRAVLGQTGVQVAGKAVTVLGSFLVVRMLTSQSGLDLRGYGEYAIVVSYIAYLWLLLDFGFNAIFVQRATNHPKSTQLEFSRLFTLRLLLSLAMMFIGLAVLTFLPAETYTTAIKIGIIASLVTVLFQGLFATGNAYFQLKLQYQYSVAIAIVSALANLLLVYLALRLGFGLTGVLIAFIVEYLILGIGAVLLVRPNLSWRVNFDWQGMKQLVLEAAPLGISVVLAIFYFRSDLFMLSILDLDPSLGYSNQEAVSLYAIPYAIFEVFLTLPAFLMNAVYPLMVRAYTQSLDSMLGLSKRTMIGAGLAGFGAIAGVWIFGAFVLNLQTDGNPDFEPSVMVLRLLSLGLPLFFMTSVMVFTLITLQRRRWLPVLYLVAGIMNIGLNLWLIPRYGVPAAALTTVITELYVLIGLSFLLIRSVRQIRRLPTQPDVINAELQSAASQAT